MGLQAWQRTELVMRTSSTGERLQLDLWTTAEAWTLPLAFTTRGRGNGPAKNT